jgi:glycosyltransferase involved in cell wall biosynthesis
MFFLQQQHPALFAAFDVYPSAKGSATHIYHNAEALFAYASGGWLAVLGDERLADYQREFNPQSVEITRFSQPIDNYLRRGQAYSDALLQTLAEQKGLRLAHFRDIWGGLPILLHKSRSQAPYKTVFEVNGLPSIELPYRYPQLPQSTLAKLGQMEQYCLQQADAVIVPSEVIRQNLLRMGLSAQKVSVISNGAEVPEDFQRLAAMPERYAIYFGALQPWQGVDTLLKAFQYLEDIPDIKLVICASSKAKQTRPYQKLVRRLGLTERIIWQYRLKKRPLYNWVHFAEFSVAPLKDCSRNLAQGCCPLKVLESMAVGTPVIASDMPAVREIIPSASLGQLVRADRPAVLARAMRLWFDQPPHTRQMGAATRQHIQKHYTWEQKKAELQALYRQLLA